MTPAGVEFWQIECIFNKERKARHKGGRAGARKTLLGRMKKLVPAPESDA